MKIKKLLAITLASVMAVSFTPGLAKALESNMNNSSFENEIVSNDVQLYKAERTNEMASDGTYSIKVGNEKPSDENQVPIWSYNYGKGMVSVVIRNVKPNTTYNVSCDVFNKTGVDMTTGILDIQGDEIESPWKIGSDRTRSTKISTEWETQTNTITTGSRTNEIYAFAYMNWTGDERGSGVFYVDNFKIEKVGDAPTTSPQTIGYNEKTADTFPETIPAIQEFNKTNDSFKLNTNNQVFSADEFSLEKAKYLAECMVNKGLIKKYTLKTIKDASEGEGIVVVKQPIKFELPNEIKERESNIDAYQIDINKNQVLIYSDYIEGIQNGTMTMLQAFAQRKILPTGSVHDYTDQVVRGLQVDSGRRYYSIDWLKDQVEQMAYYKQNKLQLRLKDNEGIRYDSKIAPEMVDRKGGFWTKEEVKELVDYARQFNIEVIPEIDFPGHAEQEAAYYKDWRLTPDADALDFSKEDVREYMISIYEEAAEFFDAKTIHIGGDEYFQSRAYPSEDETLANWAKEVTGNDSATKYDAIKIFFNEAADVLFKKDLKVLAWNDNIFDLGGAAPLNKDIIVDFWAGGIYGSISAQDTADSGYTIMSSSSTNYHDLWPEADNNKLDRPLPEMMYNEWTRYHYSYISSYPEDDEILENNKDKSLGQMFPIWDDAHGYVSEYILSRTLQPRYATFAYITWGAEYKNQENFSQLERLIFDLASPRSDMRENVSVNYTEADLTYIADTVKNALAETNSENPEVQKNIENLNNDVIDIKNNVSKYADKDGFTTKTIDDIIYRFENLDYVSTQGKVTVNYVDVDGNELLPSVVLEDEVGLDYTTEAKEIENYTLVETPSNATGTFKDEAQTVSYKYKKNDNSGANTEKPGDSSSEASKPSKTGDTTNILPFVALTLGATGLLVLTKKKKLVK